MSKYTPDSFPVHEADRCVMCGLCLPHCPTYELKKTENESPRGRIALMRAIATGKLEATADLKAHLDRCLVCGACEKACPAGVPYTRLIDSARALVAQKENSNSPASRPQETLRSLEKIEHWYPLLQLYQLSGLQKAARKTGLLRLLGVEQQERLLPRLPRQQKWSSNYPAKGEQRGNVTLFTGCSAKALDSETLQAAIYLLTRLGYSVHIPTRQNCCGALHQHGGEPHRARELALNNLEALHSDRVDAIIYLASGCGSHLHGYAKLPGLDPYQRGCAELFCSKLKEISHFVTETPWPDDLTLSPLKKRVAHHVPCSMQYDSRQRDISDTLIRRIPQIDLFELPGNHYCCGAAGNYMLRHPEIAAALLKPKLDAILELEPDIVTTTNIGCALHIRAALREGGSATTVIHPITLIARQMTQRPSR